MFDQWKSRKELSSGADVFDDCFESANVITERQLINPGQDTLVVMFPPWHSGNPYYDQFADRLSQRHTVLKYQFHDQIIEPNADRVLESHEHIQGQIPREISEIQADLNIKRTHLLGISIGNVALTRAASALDSFDSATIALAADCLADSMWQGIRTQEIKRTLEEQGMTRPKLIDKWRALAPIAYAKSFQGKQVRIVASRRDAVMPTENQIKFINGLSGSEVDLSVKHVWTGHYLTVLRQCISRGTIR